MTFINLYRDAELVFNEHRLKARLKDVNAGYNMAIDDAMEVVMKNMGGGGLTSPLSGNGMGLGQLGNPRSLIIKHLQLLKKKP